MRIKILIPIFIFLSYMLNAQIAVNTDGSAADSSAIVDIKSNNRGFLPPRITNGKRDSITNPPEGLVIYNTTYKTLDFYNGKKWVSIGKGGVYAQDTNLFQITAGTDSVEAAYDIVASDDGSFVVTGKTGLSKNSNTDMYLIRLDDKGYFNHHGNYDEIYFNDDHSSGRKIINCIQSGYLVTYNSEDDYSGDKYVLTLRLSNNLNVNDTLGGYHYYYVNDLLQIYSAAQTDNRHFYFAGRCDTIDDENWPDAFVFHTDSVGTLAEKGFYFGRSYDDNFKDIIKLNNGKLIAVGYSYNPDVSYTSCGMAVELNPDLTLNKSFGNNGVFSFEVSNYYTFFNSVVETDDGGVLIAGETNAFGQGYYDVLVIKLQSNGVIDKNFATDGILTIGGSDKEVAKKIIKTKDDNFVIAGYSYYSTWFNNIGDMYVVKITPDGSLVSGFGYNGSGGLCIGGSNDDYAESITETSNGSLVVAGYTYSFGIGQNDMYIVKLNRFGQPCSNAKAAPLTTGTGSGNQATGFVHGSINLHGQKVNLGKADNMTSIYRICH